MMGSSYEFSMKKEEEEKPKPKPAPVKDEVVEFQHPASEAGFRVDLTNDDGLGYVGQIYVGTNEAPVKVLFDTGSDFLAITSSLCEDKSLGK